MEKSADSISIEKFNKLTITGKHKVLLELAERCDAANAFSHFQTRYRQLCQKGNLDSFTPPSWLNEEEVLKAAAHFHRTLLKKGGQQAEGIHNIWQPTYSVSVILEGIRSPYNLGSVFRLVDNFGLEGIITDMSHPSPSHAQCRKSARGSENWIPYKNEPDLKSFLQGRSRPLIGVELAENAVPLIEWNPPASFDLLLGNEAYGISEQLLDMTDQIVSIPMKGFKRSMNISHALACIGFHLSSAEQSL